MVENKDFKEIFEDIKMTKMTKMTVTGGRDDPSIVEKVMAKGRVLAVKGCYDMVENVVPALYSAQKEIVGSGGLKGIDNLSAFDLIIVGCPGQGMNSEDFVKLQTFVKGGGFLLTTDLCLGNLTSRLFPDRISAFGSTGDLDTSIELVEPDHVFLSGVQVDKDFKWHIQGSGHHIKINNERLVKILITGSGVYKGPLMVTFDYYKGTVVHMVSHTHQQAAGNQCFLLALIMSNILDEAVHQHHMCNELMDGKSRILLENEPIGSKTKNLLP